MYLLNFDWLFFQVPVSSCGVLEESAMVGMENDYMKGKSLSTSDHMWRAVEVLQHSVSLTGLECGREWWRGG
jgi:hypothetical protein